ncbi:MAG TPA: type I methionyl aminopeptidase [Candidatus Avipropionibacterium avicola]|uniref:Methionine aminopeptidase n=1 Tax=Candidatus Avipropionibacterium avicola TaxID=2840701 RepID=A0A9D1KKY2_9ACTN|nr:type I methionyl aminopeptidase [Candidatus Avipropionibacterium avicola]
MFHHRKVEIKTDEQVTAMRRAGLVVHSALTAVAAEVRSGITTGELDAVAHEVIKSAGATPSFLDYGQVAGQPGFPGVVCISVNEEVVHGIPGTRELAQGDLVSVDCGAIVDGWHGDAAVTVRVGEVAPDVAGLDDTTREALWRGIAAMAERGHLSDIGHAIESYVRGLDTPYGLVTDFTGHGIGSAMHQPPDVPNHGRPGRGPKLVTGLCLAVEPMLTLGTPDVQTLDDDWTEVTRDRSTACHWEHTVAITRTGLWVLTAEDGGEAELTERGVPFGPVPL